MIHSGIYSVTDLRLCWRQCSVAGSSPVSRSRQCRWQLCFYDYDTSAYSIQTHSNRKADWFDGFQRKLIYTATSIAGFGKHLPENSCARSLSASPCARYGAWTKFPCVCCRNIYVMASTNVLVFWLIKHFRHIFNID